MSRSIASPARRPVQPGRRPPKAKAPSIIDRALMLLPVSEATLHRIVTWTIMAVVGACAIVIATVAGIPQALGLAAAEQIGTAGFRVNGIDVTGLKRMNRMTVYAVVLEQQSRAMPLVDLGEVRRKLLAYGWIADAQVSRRLPDKLVVNIIEREPAAIWQDHGQLTLIDASGVLLEPVSADAMPSLPLIIGDGANTQAPAFRQLMASAPQLRPLVKAATWIGNRRWNLTFQSGETLLLPEEDAPRALAKFAELDQTTPMLGKGWLRFDMRDPSRLVVRRPSGEAARAITDPPAPIANDAPAAAPSATPAPATPAPSAPAPAIAGGNG